MGFGAAIQQDGRILISGSSESHRFFLARYDKMGNLDESFGDQGMVKDFGALIGTNMALQSDGNIVVAGVVPPASKDEQVKMGLVRVYGKGVGEE